MWSSIDGDSMKVAAVAIVLLASVFSSQGVAGQDCNNALSPIFILPGASRVPPGVITVTSQQIGSSRLQQH
jgi:hypothetical protein